MPLVAEPTTREMLDDQLAQRILVLDGAMGTMVMAAGPTEADYRGQRFKDHAIDLKNANDVLVLTQPELIESIHREYLDAGADIIETDTFNANVISLEEFGLDEFTHEINQTAAEIARRAADASSPAVLGRRKSCSRCAATRNRGDDHIRSPRWWTHTALKFAG